MIDMCTIYLSAIRRALPQAKVAVDPFHVVQLANDKVHEVRRRVTRERHGRRGRKNDPKYGVKNLLVRNREHLSDQQMAKMWNALDGDGTTGTRQILAAWIAKEKLRDVLALSASRTGTTRPPGRSTTSSTTSGPGAPPATTSPRSSASPPPSTPGLTASPQPSSSASQ